MANDEKQKALNRHDSFKRIQMLLLIFLFLLLNKMNENNSINISTRNRKNCHTLDCTNAKAFFFSFIHLKFTTNSVQFSASSSSLPYSYTMLYKIRPLFDSSNFLIVCAPFFRISEKKIILHLFQMSANALPSCFVFQFRFVIIIIRFRSIVFDVQAFALIIFISSYSCSVTVVKDVKITSSTFVKIL